MNNTECKYDEFGVLKTKPWPVINKGDMVSYETTISLNKRQKMKVEYIGRWDGEKVEFKSENTVVRTKRWLKPVIVNKFKNISK